MNEKLHHPQSRKNGKEKQVCLAEDIKDVEDRWESKTSFYPRRDLFPYLVFRLPFTSEGLVLIYSLERKRKGDIEEQNK